ncbi:MAG: SUF system Fe-S cluster assembly regulator [Wenzhouxiangella sp.]
MLRISKLTDYATLLLGALARRSGACLPASVLAEETRLEPPTVAKVLKTLARSELVGSVRGVNGGYRLNLPANQISVAAIVRAMEGPIALTECSLEPGLCTHEASCQLSGNWRRIGEAVERTLESLSLADLIDEAPARIAIRTVVLEPAASTQG